MMTVSDLSPDALARLEAKLIADLEMVRKVRALLAEHLPRLSPSPVAATASVAAPQPQMVHATNGAETRKSYDETLQDCLVRMPERSFTPLKFKEAVFQATRGSPSTSEVKVFLNRMIRQGKVVVAEARTGRKGSLYRCTLPRPVSADAPADASAADASASVATSQQPVEARPPV